MATKATLPTKAQLVALGDTMMAASVCLESTRRVLVSVDTIIQNPHAVVAVRTAIADIDRVREMFQRTGA